MADDIEDDDIDWLSSRPAPAAAAAPAAVDLDIDWLSSGRDAAPVGVRRRHRLAVFSPGRRTRNMSSLDLCVDGIE